MEKSEKELWEKIEERYSEDNKAIEEAIENAFFAILDGKTIGFGEGVDFLSDSIEKIRPKELARNMVYDIMSKAERITKESIEKYFKNDFVQKAIEHSKLNKLDKGDLRNFMETITEAKQSNRELTEKELECVLPIAREVGYIKPWQNASVKLNEFCTGKKAFKKPTKKGIQKFDFIKKYAKVELKKDIKER